MRRAAGLIAAALVAWSGCAPAPRGGSGDPSGPAADPVGATPVPAGTIPGFTALSSDPQRRREALFLGAMSSRSAREDALALTRRPHLAGTPGAAATARWLADELDRLGFEVDVERYEPWLPHPVDVTVDVLAPSPRTLTLRELLPATAPPGLAPDAPELMHWHAYSGDGVATGEVVYANRGLADDYAALDALGVDVRGRIVLARLGGAFRGVKAREAERRGAVGLLLFPDPAGDGWAAGDTLPLGPYRPARSIQRGTVMYMWRYTGDPLTPGVPALPDPSRRVDRSARAARSDATGAAASPPTNLPSIPVVPVSAADAGLLLRDLDGPQSPEGFRGALAASYSPGPGPLRVRMEVRQRYARRVVRDVIARLPGTTEGEVVLGNHFDAWILGGVDPHSGTAATLEIARGLSALARTGWRPRRGITLAFWDAEEFGVVGSSEWVEDHLERLRARAVAYLNVDVFTAGVLDVQGSPALTELVVSAAGAVSDPVTGRSLAAHWGERFTDSVPRLGDIGAGSDWTAFLHHAGVPSLQWTMNGRGTYAVYHSVLDDFAYLSRWADSAFVHTPAFAGAMGVAALRLADADALPFRYTDYAARVEEHLEALEAARSIQLTPERVALEALRRAAAGTEARQREALERGDTVTLAAIDRALPRIEQAFLDPGGLPGRPWYHHVLTAPGAGTGYAALPLPAL
ncbi:MAG: M28 family peptidase, partial [Gemmatimonadota bacterium]